MKHERSDSSVPDMAVGQSPVVLQQQPFLRTEGHVEVQAVSTVYMEQEWNIIQISQ